jgi:hypothetical protein
MIRLKQKKAAEEKKAEEVAPTTNTDDSLVQQSDVSESNKESMDIVTEQVSMNVESTPIEESEGLKLLGIGGKSTRTADGSKRSGKKKTPGEIRIQKGMPKLKHK